MRNIRCVFVLFLVFIFFANSSNAAIVINEDVEVGEIDDFDNDLYISDNDSFYGFIIPEKQVNSKTRNMVNDILRENVSVYWSKNDFNTTICRIKEGSNVSNYFDMFFGKGSFIIPFTGDLRKDTIICIIVHDYNNSCEVTLGEDKIVPVYLLKKPISNDFFLLKNVNIVQIENELTGTNIEYCYMSIGFENGFFSFDYMKEEKMFEELVNEKYNLLIWPGGQREYYDAFKTLVKSSTTRDSSTEAIRRFVSNGGGFVGSCYGAIMASTAFLPMPIYLKRRAYNPKIRSYALLAISDIITHPTKLIGLIQVNIINTDHPVTFGIGQKIYTYISNGPKVLYVGENSEVIGIYENCSPIVSGSPGWISSNFGDGKVVVFTTHPEMVTYDEDNNDIIDKVISNTFYYSTYEELINFELTYNQNFSFITNVWSRTNNLLENISKDDSLFEDIKDMINQTKDLIDKLEVSVGWKYLSSDNHYFEDTKSILNEIEIINSLLKNKQKLLNFTKKMKILINETNSLLLKISEGFDRYIEKTQKFHISFKAFEPFLRIKLLLQNYYAKKYLKNIYKPMNQIPNIYYKSIEFLRQSWYEYEIKQSL